MFERNLCTQKLTFPTALASPDTESEVFRFDSDVSDDQHMCVFPEWPGNAHDLSALKFQGQDLVRGTVTVDDAYFTSRVRIHSGDDPYRDGCASLFDFDFSHSFVRQSVFVQIIHTGVAQHACARATQRRSWGGFSTPAP